MTKQLSPILLTYPFAGSHHGQVLVFNKIEMLLELEFATAGSLCPSLLKSATAANEGAEPNG